MTIVTFGGAGNAGKTTVLDLLAKYMAHDGQSVLAIDSNPDQTLLSFAGFTDDEVQAVPHLCDHFDRLKELLEGKNNFYPDLKKVVGTSPVTAKSGLWHPQDEQDPVIQQFSALYHGVRYMQTGTYEASDIGRGCLHTKIEALIFALQRLDDGHDGKKSVTMIDQAHGRDAFGTPIYAQGDILLIATRADRKSLDILKDYLSIAKDIEKTIGHSITMGVVGNGIASDDQLQRIQSVAGTHYITSLHNDPALNREYTNAGPELHQLKPENLQALSRIATAVNDAERMPLRRKVWLDFCHHKKEWMDVMMGPDVRAQKTDFVLGGHHQCSPGCNHNHD